MAVFWWDKLALGRNGLYLVMRMSRNSTWKERLKTIPLILNKSTALERSKDRIVSCSLSLSHTFRSVKSLITAAKQNGFTDTAKFSHTTREARLPWTNCNDLDKESYTAFSYPFLTANFRFTGEQLRSTKSCRVLL